jgi:mono/diheme cytochrome c family protein
MTGVRVAGILAALALSAVGAAPPVLPAPRAAPAEGAAEVDFNRDVLPILAANCFACHGPDAEKRKADLRLDVRTGAVGKGGVIVPGKPEQSELIDRLTAADAEGRMPPPKAGPRLTPEQVKVLRAWVEQGAQYTEHWAFVPPKRPEVPKTKAQSSNPIDAFVLARLEKDGLKPAPRAAREVLIRRAALDLTGLPPSPEEVAAFLKDDAPDAWAKVVDRLLASPHYGERWGRHWLDVARYADSGGFETDIFFGSAWRYRDYVIRSFNADKPFDRFVKEQIAGDELFPNDRDALVATALYTLGPVLQEANMVQGKLEYDWLTDTVDTTGSAFLGLTVGCARCHDHKYDPIAQKDYFGLQAGFAASDLFDYKSDGTVLRDHVALRKTDTEFELARKKLAPKKQPGDFDEYPEIPLRGLGHRVKAKQFEVRLLKRGELDAPGELVKPSLPSKLAGAERAVPRDRWRANLAEWIASKDNPLTARVIANRVWQWHFGHGLVRTPNDFGVRGERPTHPELLDWLAVEFADGEKPWSFKRLHRLILLSNTYQMSASATAETLRLDPDNRLLSRFQPRRVEAEVVWDAVRMAAGTLDRRMHGLPIFPPLDERELVGNYKKWPADRPEDANRRAVYIVARRSFRFPALGAFDPPENVSSCGQRDCTVVPNQALTLLNNSSVREQAASFAGRLLRETDRNPEAVAERAWLIAYGRKPTPDERADAVAFLRAREKAAPATVPDPRKTAVTELCVALFNTNEFIYLP